MTTSVSSQAGGGEVYTANQQTLLFYYMCKYLNVNRNTTDITEMARVFQGLTGRQTGAKEIKNTDAYKRLSNPLKDRAKGSFQNDLRFVRDIFERFARVDIAEEISKEIHDQH